MVLTDGHVGGCPQCDAKISESSISSGAGDGCCIGVEHCEACVEACMRWFFSRSMRWEDRSVGERAHDGVGGGCHVVDESGGKEC